MNDLSAAFGEDERLNRAIVELAILGKPVADIARTLNVTLADVCRVIDREATAVLSPANRVRMIWASLMRIGELHEVFHKQAKCGDVQSGALCVKLEEREATLIGLNAPLKVDPIELALEATPKAGATQSLLDAIARLKSEDKRRLRNGGAGYGPGSWQDIQDREEMAKREPADG